MQTLTLKIEDSYYQKVVDFLELLPILRMLMNNFGDEK